MIRRLPLFAVLFFVFFSVFLTGCATLNEDQCRTADWYDLGMRDGRNGYTQSRLAEHYEACAKHGIRPDERLYGDGRRAGLHDYCELDNALREGLSGRRYQGVCPSGIDRDFRNLNEAAYGVYDARRELDNVKSQIHSLEVERENKKTLDPRRKQIREELRELDRKYEQLRDNLRWRERDLDRMSGTLRDRPWQR